MVCAQVVCGCVMCVVCGCVMCVVCGCVMCVCHVSSVLCIITQYRANIPRYRGNLPRDLISNRLSHTGHPTVRTSTSLRLFGAGWLRASAMAMEVGLETPKPLRNVSYRPGMTFPWLHFVNWYVRTDCGCAQSSLWVAIATHSSRDVLCVLCVWVGVFWGIFIYI